MRSLIFSSFALVALSCGVGCSATTTQTGTVVPLKRVRLYETGVGYFERSGQLGGEDGASLPVPSGHVDDALKSLVVLGGQSDVGHVMFDSRQSPAVARARARLPADTATAIGFEAVLESLIGERVTLSDAERTVTGRLVDRVTERIERAASKSEAKPSTKEDPLESEEKAPADDLIEREMAVVLTEDNDFVRMEVARLKAVRPLDPNVRERYLQALEAQAALAGGQESQLDILSGQAGPITLGYLAETPVWRTSYRLVFGNKEQPVLSAWALVHNDTEEDWRQVMIELANGRPDSFLFPLAAPRYERRELVTPPRELSSVPQLLGETPDAMWGDFIGDSFGVGGLGLTGYGAGGGGTGSGYGYGSGHGRLGRSRAASDLLSVGDLSKVNEAQGKDAPTVFIYKSTKPLDLPAQRSALVPFLQRPMDAKIITWFDGFDSETGRFAISFVNSGDTTLPGGPVAVFADGGFAGETALDRLAPGERRFAPIADDLDVELDKTNGASESQPKKLIFRNGRLEEHYLRRREVDFTLTNRSGRDREVFIELDASNNAKVEGAERVDYDQGRARPLAIFKAAAGTKEVQKSITIVEGLVTSSALESLDTERLDELANEDTLSASDRAIAKDVAQKQRVVDARREALADLEQELADVEKDIERLRGHLEAMAEQPAGADNPVLTRLLATEDRLAELRKQKKALQGEVEKAIETVEAALAPLEQNKVEPLVP